MGQGGIGGNGSVQWSIRHTAGPGGHGQGSSAGGDGTDAVRLDQMRRRPGTNDASFLVTLRNATPGQQPGTYEVPVVDRGPNAPPANANAPLEIKIDW